MKRLFLTSSGLGYIREFVGRDPSEVKLLFIPTAGNLDENVWWIDKDRDVLEKMGFIISELDIANSSLKEMQGYLKLADIVYIAGGNTFYLLKQLQETGFGELVKSYAENGGLYAGASAGALVAGLDIEPVSSIDEPEKVYGLKSTEGLGLVDMVPVPHYDMASNSKLMDEIKAKYIDKFELVFLTDDEAIAVEGNEWKLVGSERSPLEHEWFNKNHDELA